LTVTPTLPSAPIWLTIKDAAAQLGISEGTLRAWADAGEVPSHRTLGGHRRFLQSELAAHLESHGRNGGSTEALSEKAISRIRRRMVSSEHGPGAWMALLTETEKLLLREQGRRLAALAAEYLDRPRRRQRIGREAFEIGGAYGLCLRGHQVSLSHAMDAFVFFRNLVAATADRPVSGGDAPLQAQEVQRQLQGLLDQVMMGMVDAYEHPSVGAGA
jgi:excisionase family DNA binding protein